MYFNNQQIFLLQYQLFLFYNIIQFLTFVFYTLFGTYSIMEFEKKNY